MIACGSSNRCVSWWAQHLEAEVNEETRVVQTHGLGSDNVREMLDELMDLARGTRCKNPFYEIHFSPAPGECLTEKQWDRAREIIEQHHGFEGQPYFMMMHTKHGEEHAHFVYSRIDLESGKTISDSYDARTNHAISRQIEEEFGLRKVVGPYDLEPDTPRPERAPKRWEMLRAMETGIDPRDVAAQVTGLLQQCDTGLAFKAALEEHGYELVTGRRGLLILDPAGDEHSLARRCGIKAKELDAFMCDVDRAALPTFEQAKAARQDRKIAELEADRATVSQEIEWQEKLAQAAIDKEKIEHSFAEPEKGTLTGGQQLTGPTRDIREASERSDNAQAFLAALGEHGIDLARVTKADALQSQLDSTEASTRGYWKPTFHEGEIVAVTGQGQLYRLTPRNTGKDSREIEQFMAGLQTPLPSVDEIRHKRQQQERELATIKAAAEPELNKTTGDIRLAYNLADGPQAFREFVAQAGLTAARVTAPDIQERDSIRKQEDRHEAIRGWDAGKPELLDVDHNLSPLPVAEGMIRMYRGIGNNVWPSEHGEALFFSTDPSRAAAFGKLHYVDVTAAEMAKFEQPHSKRILEHEPIAKNDWRTADPGIIARLEPFDAARTATEPGTDVRPTPQAAPEKSSHRLSDYAREGDVVVLDKWGNIYELTNRTTGDTRQNAQASLAGIGYLPSLSDARDDLEEKRKQQIGFDDGPHHGGLVAHQMWALRRIQDADQQHREQQRRQEEHLQEEHTRPAEEARKTTGDIDPDRYLSDPDYRREVKHAQGYQTPQEQKADRENDLRALLEQQDRQR